MATLKSTRFCSSSSYCIVLIQIMEPRLILTTNFNIKPCVFTLNMTQQMCPRPGWPYELTVFLIHVKAFGLIFRSPNWHLCVEFPADSSLPVSQARTRRRVSENTYCPGQAVWFSAQITGCLVFFPHILFLF